jgi:disulfide bond formation protein DsbB
LADKIIHGLELDTVLPEVFEPRASCADAIFHFLGVPYEVWAFMLYIALALGAALAIRKTCRSTTLNAS